MELAPESRMKSRGSRPFTRTGRSTVLPHSGNGTRTGRRGGGSGALPESTCRAVAVERQARELTSASQMRLRFSRMRRMVRHSPPRCLNAISAGGGRAALTGGADVTDAGTRRESSRLTAEHAPEVRLVGETRVECHIGERDVAALYPFARPFDAKSVDVAGHRTAHVRVKGARQVSRMNSRDASERLVIEAAAEVCADELPRCREPARWAPARRGARVVRLGEKSVHEALDGEVGDRIV